MLIQTSSLKVCSGALPAGLGAQTGRTSGGVSDFGSAVAGLLSCGPAELRSGDRIAGRWTCPEDELGTARAGLPEGQARVRMAALVALKGVGTSILGRGACCLGERPGESAGLERKVAARALDTLLSLPGLRPKRLAMDYLSEHPQDDEVCAKIARSLEPPESGTEYFAQAIDQILKKHPHHSAWESLVALRERLGKARTAAPQGTPEQAHLEARLEREVKGYLTLEEPVRLALRSAEMPFARPEILEWEWISRRACWVQAVVLLERSWVGAFFSEIRAGTA